MRIRELIGSILYFVAIAAPTAWLYTQYGLTTPVDPASADDLAVLASTVAVGFVLALVAAKISQTKTMSYFQVLQEVVRGIQQQNGGRNDQDPNSTTPMQAAASRVGAG